MAVTWKKLAFDDEVASLSDTTPLSVGTAGAAGTGTDASRDDHVHDLGADCIDSGLLIADTVIDSEHIVADAIDNAHIGDDQIDSEHYVDGSIDTAHIAADAIDDTLIADDAVGSEHIEALSADLDVAGNELTDACLHNSASDPVTPILGKVYFKTGDLHPYVCTVIA